MYTPSFLEQLPVLQERAVELLERIFEMLEAFSTSTNEGQLLFTSEMDKARKQINKCFPQTVTLEAKTQDHLQSVKLGVVKVLQRHYQTMVDVEEFTDLSFQALNTFFTDIQTPPTSLHPALARDVLNLFVSYVKVQLLWTIGSNGVDVNGFIGLHIYSHRLVNNEADANACKVQQYIANFMDIPLDAIRIQLKQNTMASKLLLMVNFCGDLYKEIRDLTQLRNNGYFNIDECATGSLCSQKIYEDIWIFDLIPEWVIYTCLCCPEFLTNPNAMEVLESVGSDYFVIPLHRDRNISFHNYFYQMVGSKHFHGVLIDAKLKKKIRRIGKNAVHSSGVLHHERQIFCCWVLRQLYHLVLHDNHLIPPLLPMLLSSLKLAQSEIFFYCTHTLHQVPPYIKSKYYNADSYHQNIQQVNELVYLIAQCRILLQSSQYNISLYYAMYLKQAHSKQLQQLIHSLTSTNSLKDVVDQRVLQLIHANQTMLNDTQEPIELNIFMNLNGNEQLSKNNLITRMFESNWLKIAMYLLSTGITVDSNFYMEMNTVCYYLNCIEKGLVQTIQKATSVTKLWWYREQYQALYEYSLHHSPLYSLSHMKTIDNFQYAIDASSSQASSDMESMEQVMQQYADRFYKLYGLEIEKTMYKVYQELVQLHNTSSELDLQLKQDLKKTFTNIENLRYTNFNSNKNIIHSGTAMPHHGNAKQRLLDLILAITDPTTSTTSVTNTVTNTNTTSDLTGVDSKTSFALFHCRYNPQVLIREKCCSVLKTILHAMVHDDALQYWTTSICSSTTATTNTNTNPIANTNTNKSGSTASMHLLSPRAMYMQLKAYFDMVHFCDPHLQHTLTYSTIHRTLQQECCETNDYYDDRKISNTSTTDTLPSTLNTTSSSVVKGKIVCSETYISHIKQWISYFILKIIPTNTSLSDTNHSDYSTSSSGLTNTNLNGILLASTTLNAYIVHKKPAAANHTTTNSSHTTSANKSSGGAIEAEIYESLHQLHLLASIIGMHGVTILKNTVVDIILDQVKCLKGCIELEKDFLIEFKRTIVNPTIIKSNMARLAILDKITYHTILIGHSVFILKLLQNAILRVSQDQVPILETILQLLQFQIPTTSAKQKTKLTDMAMEIGMENRDNDNGVGSILNSSALGELQKLNMTKEDHDLWELAPYAYAASFCSQYWKTSNYHPTIDAMDYNLHLCVYAHTLLCNAFQPASLLEKTSLQHFMKLCTIVVLDQSMTSTSSPTIPTTALIYLDKLSQYNHEELNYGYLKKRIPSALLQSAYSAFNINYSSHSNNISSTLSTVRSTEVETK